MTDKSDKKISYEDLVKQFEDQYETSLKPDLILTEEIDRIDLEVQSLIQGYKSSDHMVMNDPVNDSRFFSDISETEQRKAFKKGYDAGFKSEPCPDLTGGNKDNSLLVIIRNGYAYGKYAQYLMEIKAGKGPDAESKTQTPLKTQMAILEFLGVNKELVRVGTKQNASKLLSILLNRSEEAIRREFSKGYLLEDEFKTKNKPKQETWREIENLFQSLDYKEVVAKIRGLREKYRK